MAKSSVLNLKESGFEKLAPSVWKYSPNNEQKASEDSKDNVEPPAMVVLCPWTGAKSGHIDFYTERYKELYPFADIVVITTSLIDICFRSSESKQKRLASALEPIKGKENLLMHVFSDGGSNKACELAEAFKSENKSCLPVKVLCLDSTPGKPHYRRLCKAFSKVLPPLPMMRPVGLVLGSIVIGSKWIFYDCIKGFEQNVMSRTRKRLLDGQLWDPSASRLYLYSKGDALVSSHDIYTHAKESEEKGIPVFTKEFKESRHVRHGKDEAEYWPEIQNTWENRMSTVRNKQVKLA
ncbi:Indole-diterpene biosynthesis protein [Pyrenophora tritici-repentis]|nr:Indole-diterpene biosynthesis protein [Pyrenophora tritici-repentis]